ncbi:MAG: Crp/Fnr family transcriptional regulator [Campylobacterales bacterium]|nr:Crp/Fnr family transcriptional regulator [Campylobacterales bacterium]
MVEDIQKIQIFASCSLEELEYIASISKITTYPKGATLYYEQDMLSHLIFLLDGRIKVYKVDKYENEIFLYHIYSYSMVSELSSLESDTIYCYSNSEFLEDSRVLVVDYLKFRKRFLKASGIVSTFIHELITKNQQLQCIINRELVFDASAKVAYMLLDDLEMFNTLKRTQSAFLLHIQPETLSRVLKKMTRNGIISLTNGKVSIENTEALIALMRGENR